MKLHIHIVICLIISTVFHLNFGQTIFLLISNSIDIDHIGGKGYKCYEPNISSFDIRPLHIIWPVIFICGYIINVYVGYGILAHIILDYIDNIIIKTGKKGIL